MMDDFEKYISDNAEAFNTERADRDNMWLQINTVLEAGKTKVVPLYKRKLFLKIAASLMALMVITFFYTHFKPGIVTENQLASKELLEIDMHYKSLVNYQVALVQKNPKLSTADKNEFLSFMDELDAEYLALKKEMETNLDNEQVLEAIVANYKKRIELIEKLLERLNETKKFEQNYEYTL